MKKQVPGTEKILIAHATIKDAEEILKLQKLAYISEAELYDNFSIPPLTQTLEETLEDFRNYVILEAVFESGLSRSIIGSVRGQLNAESACYIGRLMNAIEAEFPQVDKFTLGTGQHSERNLYLYHKLGFRDTGYEHINDELNIVHLEKTKYSTTA